MKKPFATAIISLSIALSCVGQRSNRMLAKEILADSSMDTVYNHSLKLLEKGFQAGDGYPQTWIRDFNTFIEIASLVYNKDSIRNNLLTFLRLQQANGEIVDGYVLKGHFNWEDHNTYTSDNAPNHIAFKNTVETDQETSLVQAIHKYISCTKDTSILFEKIASFTVRERLEKAIDYLLKERFSKRYGLLKGGTTMDWGDVQVEGGAVVDIDKYTHWCVDIYDNAMFVIALENMAGFYSNRAIQKKWLLLKEVTAANIRKYLWDNKHGKFIPHLYTASSPFPKYYHESAIYFNGGTAIAIEAGLLSKLEIEKVNHDMLKNVALSGAPSIGLTIYPIYPDSLCKTCKPYHYQNGGDWTWFGARMVRQLLKAGFVDEAYTELKPMIDRTIKDKGFYEWYGVHNEPNGSADFKGSAGVLASVIHDLKEWANNHL